MRTVAIIQARMHSTRLPGKMLLPLCGAPLIQRVLERVERATQLDEVVLAIPARDWTSFTPVTHDPIHLFTYFGEEEDLVGRYLAAAKEYDADLIVRVPGDNPCVDPAYIDAAITTYLEYPVLYYSNTTEQITPACAVDGVGAEVFSLSRLKWLDALTQTIDDPELREHPHRYFERVGELDLPEADLRLDVNTADGYAFVADIYNSIYPHTPHFTTADVLAYLEVSHAPQKRLQQKSH